MALFDINVHHFIHYRPDNDSEIVKLLKELIILNTENMAKTKQEFKDLKADIQGSISNIADDIDRLVAQAQRQDLTEAEEEEVFTDFSELAGQLRVIAGKVPDQQPPVDPPADPPVE